MKEQERDYKSIILNLEQIEGYTYNHRIDKPTMKTYHRQNLVLFIT